MIVVSDTSPVANLIQIGQLHLLRAVFTEVVIPPAVHREILALEKFNTDLSEFLAATWFSIREPTDRNRTNRCASQRFGRG